MTTHQTLADAIRNLRNEKAELEQRQRDIAATGLSAKTFAEITKATSLLMHQKILKAAKDGLDRVVICDTRTVPSFDGTSIYSLFRKEVAGGNLFCAFRDLELTFGQIYNKYPAFCAIRDHYLAHGLKVHLSANYDGGGMEDWIELVVTF